MPSKDGLEAAHARVRDYLAWEIVREDVKKQQRNGNVDPARAQTLQINIDKAKGRIPDAVRQAYCVVVTVSEKDETQAFKITVSDEPHFNIIKADRRSRVQDTAITAEALLPDGPYNLWRNGETSRRVKDLAGAFAQLPHLPKMLKAGAILDTLIEGCEQGTFVLRLIRPDRTFRTWWMSRPDESAMSDPALELVLPEAAELAELLPELLSPGKLPGLWKDGGETTLKGVTEYFNGENVVQVDRGEYKEPIRIPKAAAKVVKEAVSAAVEDGTLWLLSGPASILGETIPTGVLTADSKLCAPPEAIAAAEILPENLPDAWEDDTSNGLSIATALSVKAGRTLPWKTVKDVLSAALQARFIEIEEGAGSWPCEYPSAQTIKFRVAGAGVAGADGIGGAAAAVSPKILTATAELEPAGIQDLADIVPKLLEIKARSNVPIKFQVRIELGDGSTAPSQELRDEVNRLLKDIEEGLELG